MSLYRTVMLIDDDKEDQEIFSDAIREVDSSVRFVSESNSDEAISNIGNSKKPRPDLIFLDMNMPRVNGKQLLAELKSVPEMSEIPVVMCSTFFGDRDVTDIGRLGAVHFLVKPTKFNDLCNEIARILRTKW
jgi:CheY-like chemotaxis protein